MNILMFGWEFPPHNTGGLGTACKGLTKALIDENIDVTFVMPRKVHLDEDWLHVLFAGVKNITIKTVDTLLMPYMSATQYSSTRFSYNAGIYANDLLSEVRRYGELVEAVVESGNFDIIHAHEWLSFVAGLRAKELTGLPLVLHVHSTEIDRSGGSVYEEIFNIEKNAFQKADRIIAVSQFTKNILVDTYGIEGAKIEVVHNGVEIPPYMQTFNDSNKVTLAKLPFLQLKKTGHKIVLYVGRYSMHKGPDYFLKAAKKVHELMPEAVFIMAGSGEMEHQLIEMAADLGLTDCVHFAGYLRNEELSQLYASADVYVLPSLSEPFGIAPLESLIHKTPVILSKQSGVSEILQHVLKVDFWDTDALASKICAVLEYPELAEELSKSGHRQALHFNWKDAAKKVINIYKKYVTFN